MALWVLIGFYKKISYLKYFFIFNYSQDGTPCYKWGIKNVIILSLCCQSSLMKQIVEIK